MPLRALHTSTDPIPTFTKLGTTSYLLNLTAGPSDASAQHRNAVQVHPDTKNSDTMKHLIISASGAAQHSIYMHP